MTKEKAINILNDILGLLNGWELPISLSKNETIELFEMCLESLKRGETE